MNEPIYVIGYARVSTPRQAQSGESLDDQERDIRKHVLSKGYTLFPENTVFRENYTGTTTVRPVYEEIKQLIKKNKGKIKYFIFWDFDRLTRNGDFDYEKIWADLAPFNIEPRDTFDVIQPEVNYFAEYGDYGYDFAKGRPSEEAEYAKVQGAKLERKKILRRLIKPQIRLTKEGYHIGRPDEGYKNEKVFVENKKKCIQVPDPDRAPFIVKMFELRAEGIYSDQEIVDEINKLGYRTPEIHRWTKDRRRVIGKIGGNKLTVKQLQRVIARVTYCGIVCEKWTDYLPIKAKYKGLVSIEKFNQANRGKVFIREISDGTVDTLRNLSKLSLRRKRFNPEFPVRGIVLCDICEKPMTASPSRGKSGKHYLSYHCSRSHKRFAVPKSELEKEFNGLINKLAFTEDTLNILEKSLIFTFRQKEGELSIMSAQANMAVAELETKKSNLIQSFAVATLDVVRKGIEEQIMLLQTEIDKAKSERKEVELKEEDITDFIQWGRSLMEHPAKMLDDIESLQEQHAMYGLIFEVFPTYSEILNGTPKLSPVFRLNKEKVVNENQMVTLRGIEPRFHP